MDKKEFEIVQEEKSIAFLRGVVAGATGASVTILVTLILIHYGL